MIFGIKEKLIVLTHTVYCWLLVQIYPCCFRLRLEGHIWAYFVPLSWSWCKGLWEAHEDTRGQCWSSASRLNPSGLFLGVVLYSVHYSQALSLASCVCAKHHNHCSKACYPHHRHLKEWRGHWGQSVSVSQRHFGWVHSFPLRSESLGNTTYWCFL